MSIEDVAVRPEAVHPEVCRPVQVRNNLVVGYSGSTALI